MKVARSFAVNKHFRINAAKLPNLAILNLTDSTHPFKQHFKT